MHETLLAKIESTLNDFQSLEHMTMENIGILTRLNYVEVPELNRAFNTGVVFASIIELIVYHHHPKIPPDEDIQEAYGIVMKFLAGGFKN